MRALNLTCVEPRWTNHTFNHAWGRSHSCTWDSGDGMNPGDRTACVCLMPVLTAVLTCLITVTKWYSCKEGRRAGLGLERVCLGDVFQHFFLSLNPHWKGRESVDFHENSFCCCYVASRRKLRQRPVLYSTVSCRFDKNSHSALQ